MFTPQKIKSSSQGYKPTGEMEDTVLADCPRSPKRNFTLFYLPFYLSVEFTFFFFPLHYNAAKKSADLSTT